MTGRLPRLYEFFVPGEVVRHEELSQALHLRGNSLRKHLWALTRSGDLHPIRRGLYAVQGRGGEKPCPSPYVVGSHVTPQARLGFETALEFYAGRVPAPGTVLSIVSPGRFRRFCYDRYWYLWCEPTQAMDDRGGGGTRIREVFDASWGARAIRVATPELALIEVLARPLQIEDFASFVALCAALKTKPCGQELAKLCQGLGRGALAARLGVVLDLVGGAWPHAASLRQSLVALQPQRPFGWSVRGAEAVFAAWPQLVDVLSVWRVRLVPRAALVSPAPFLDIQGGPA